MLHFNLQSRKLTILLVGLTTWFLLCTLVMTVMVLVFDKLFISLLYREIVYLPGRRLFENWRNPTIPIYFKVHLFNVTNPEGILQGEKPRVQEVGPFVYREKRTIRKILFSKEDPPKTVDFLEEKHYVFLPDRSVGDPAKITVTIPDLFFAESSLVGGTGRFLLRNQAPFITLNGYSAIWKTEFARSLWDTMRVGVFSGKNDSKPLNMVMETGAYDLMRAGKIRSVKGKKIRDVWDTEEANLIGGIQGVRLPPDTRLGTTVEIQMSDLCRTVPLTATDTAPSSQLPELSLMKFTAPEASQLESTVHWTNRMYCKFDQDCTPRGFLALRPCAAQYGFSIPLYISFPYFMEADPRVAKRIDGLPTPTREKHEIYLLVEPTTGLTLEAYLRFQMNVFMWNKNERYKNMSGPYYFPLAWVELEIVTPRESVRRLKEMVIDLRQNTPYVMSIVAVVCGVLSLLLFLTMVVRLRFYRTHGSANLALQFHDVDESTESCKDTPLDNRFYHMFPKSESREVLEPTDESDQLSIPYNWECEAE